MGDDDGGERDCGGVSGFLFLFFACHYDMSDLALVVQSIRPMF